MPEMQENPREESVWKRLTRLFRSGPIVRHKIAAGEQANVPQGTARAYKRELSSLYVHSMASYGQYERLSRYADYCFHPETLVYTTTGVFTIKELAERYPSGERFCVYAYDASRNKLVIADAHSPRLKHEGKIEKLVRVEFDDGGSVTLTPDHNAILRDGSKVRVDQLNSGDSLMPFYRKDFVGHGYQWIYTMDRSRSKNGWELEHRLSVEHTVGRQLKDDEEIHHIDFNPSNNHPDNLKLWTRAEHRKYHAVLNNKNKLGKTNQKHTAWMLEHNPVKRNDVNFASVIRAASQCDYHLGQVCGILGADRPAVKRRIKERGFSNWNDLVSHRSEIERGITFEVIKRESVVSKEQILEEHRGCVTMFQLSCKIGCTEKAIARRVHDLGYAGWVEFKKANDPEFDPKQRYQQLQPVLNHKVRSVVPVESDQVYNITVEEYHNLAVGSQITDENGKSSLSCCILSQSEMEFTPELASALDIYADETTAYNEDGKILNIISSDDEVREILQTLFFDILNVEFNIWSWVRNLVKYGDFVLFVDASDSNGILNLLPIPINEIEREEGYDPKDPFAVRFRWLTQGNMILENWQIIHFRLLGVDNFLPYGSSIIEPARRIWRQLILIEDAMMVYRIVRSPERRVFRIDVGNIPPGDVDTFMEQIKNKLRRNQVVDPSTGRVDLRYNPLSVDEDYFIPTRGDKGSEITTLAGGQFTGDIDDVQYIQNKMFAAIKIPKAYLGYEGEIGSKATLAQQDVRFSRTIERIQKIVIAELNKIAIIHLFLLGYHGSDLVNFSIEMASASSVAEQQKLELWRTRFEIAGTAQEGVLDRSSVYRKIFNMTDDDIERIREGKRIDKLEDLQLEAMQLPPDGSQAPAPEEGGGSEGSEEGGEELPGEDELPQTLGGEPGGDESGASGAETQPESVVRSEKRNPGSEGDRAEVSVSKGKDLFSTGEDPNALVFGREKQTASDPYDARSLRRLITRPFSDGVRRSQPSDTIFEQNNRVSTRADDMVSECLREIRSLDNVDREIVRSLPERNKSSRRAYLV